MRRVILLFGLCGVVGAQTIPAGTSVLLRLEQAVSSKFSKVNDRLFLRLETPIIDNATILVPAGSYAEGRISKVRRSPRLKGEAELLIEIQRIRLQDGATWVVPSPRFRALPRVRSKHPTADAFIGAGVGTFGLLALVSAVYESPEAAAINGAPAALLLATKVLRRGPEIEAPAGTAIEVVWDQDVMLVRP